ncbi:Fe-S cluster assembly protein SufD [Salinibacillus xinjiangensis]|uniref:Fe-S cluster assembly protein SufD n=1 Tax=Salinibacillus xinjiangensis TaxID=1229268 RepID=A0A6G1X2V3_9BACI|nr:Fe-S cluster assembly protein SufD [Salinibacillus xinjiangensis]MRG85158.1 Fe-S cluster assembly protein SufD [Salinibacillus xinjiangensis]
MAVETKLPYDKQYVTQFSEGRGEPDWMKNFRLEALEQAENLPMPKPEKTKIDKWNFTNFTHHVSGDKVDSIDELPDEIKAFFNEDKSKNVIIQRNHSVAFSSVSETLTDKGVIFTDIQTALHEHPDLVKKYYMRDAIKVDDNRLTALHAALLNGGVFVYVPKNVVIEDPLQVVFWQEDDEAALYNHVLLVADQGSEVTYVENYISQNTEKQSVANIVTEVVALDQARVSYGAVDNFATGTTTYVNRRGVAYRDAKIEWAIGQMNDGNTISENVTNLMGDNSYAEAKAVSVGRGDQKQNFVANITHFGKFSEGYILQHGVMKDDANSIFSGIGKIEHGAMKSDAQQESRVLMLSQGARGDANPILLIDEDDVTAGHAASVGRVDPVQLYYLMSRGISKAEAERLIIHGFLNPVVEQIPIEAVRKQLTQVIERKVN